MTARPQTYETLVVLLALAGIGVAGLLATRQTKGPNISDYFLASRSVGWFPLAISLSVTTIWGIGLLSVWMSAPFGLLGWLIPSVVAIAGVLVLGIAFTPRYRATEAATIPTFLRDRYGKGVGFVVAVVSILLTLLVHIPFTIYVGTRSLSALWAWEPMTSALLMIVVPGLFAVAGGYRAVIAMQSAAGIAVAAGLLFLVLKPVSLPNPISQGLFPGLDAGWEVLLASALVVGFWYTCIDQFMVQRAFAGRSCASVRAGTGLAAVLVLLGIAALATGFTSNGTPALNGNGIEAGFVGAAIIAFGIATLSGQFMSVATLFTMDLVHVNRRKNENAAMVLVGRMTNTVVVFLAILTASSVALVGTGSLEWMARGSAVAIPPVAAVTGIGLLWPRMHGRGAFWGLFVGWLVGGIFLTLSISDPSRIMQGLVLTFACSGLVFVAVSLLSVPSGSIGPAPGAMLEKGLGARNL